MRRCDSPCSSFSRLSPRWPSRAPAAAQPAGPDLTIDAAARAKVIEGALAALTRYYVFPDVAGKMQAQIRRHVAAKKYDALTSARAFAEALTADLRAVSRDKHLRVIFSPEPIADRKPDAPPPPAAAARFRDQVRFWNAGYVKAERLDGNIGYLRLDGFAPAAEAAPRAAAAMTLLADTGALIIDLRWNGGGDPASVALLVSYLFAAADERHIDTAYLAALEKVRPTIDGKQRPGMAKEIEDAIVRLRPAKK